MMAAVNNMKLDPRNHEQYWDRGWVVVEGVFEPPEVDGVIQRATAISENEVAELEGKYQLDQDAEGRIAPRKIDAPFTKDEGFRQFVMNERLCSLIAQLIGKPPLLIMDQIFMKPPHFGSAKPYHQDNAYFLCHPDDDVITAWIALDDVDETNGCLRYIEGSHRGPILEHRELPGEPHNKVPPSELIDLNREALAIVKRGGVVFHHSKTLHTSHRNRSDRWRRGYATHWGTADVTSEIETIDKAYYNANRELYGSVDR